ncbi:glucosamine inositolphosphorylceramide transferase family protein [Caballeronia grimmiae]|uniref:glucosamine inositolphosphorylceramide transferase family protein n=1 Tax=Caballeronia grimmiae TaxID=1071679 RepID=UPI0038BB3C32
MTASSTPDSFDDRPAQTATRAPQRFPLMLALWTALERAAYRAPRVCESSLADGHGDPQCAVAYNGAWGVASLWRTLLRRETPHLQMMWRAPDGRLHLVAESHVALPNREFFCASLALALERQRQLGERARQRLREMPHAGAFPIIDVADSGTRPSPADVLHFAIRHLFGKTANKFRRAFSRSDHWGIAWRSDDTSDAREATWHVRIPSPNDRFYADPFLWRDAAGGYHLFFEDLPYATNKGVISHVALDPDSKSWIAPPRVVLERPYHLSYPFLFEHAGDIFMIPETSANRTIEVYRAAPFPDAWVHHATLMENIVAADTTLFHEAGTWWLFTTIEQGSGPNWDELHLYHARSPFGPWHAHPANPVVSDCRGARMAGNIFRDDNGRLIRPAQDCEREYGAALRFCEITEMSASRYAETPVSVMNAPSGRSGVHTWNRTGDVTVVDIKMGARKGAGAQSGYCRL